MLFDLRSLRFYANLRCAQTPGYYPHTPRVGVSIVRIKRVLYSGSRATLGMLASKFVPLASLALCVITVVSGCGSKSADKTSYPIKTNAVGCTKSRQTLSNLRMLSNETSVTFNGTAHTELERTLSNLRALVKGAPNQDVSTLARSIQLDLTGLEVLAEADPGGSQAATRARAQSLEQQYLASSQRLSTAVKTACANA